MTESRNRSTKTPKASPAPSGGVLDRRQRQQQEQQPHDETVTSQLTRQQRWVDFFCIVGVSCSSKRKILSSLLSPDKNKGNNNNNNNSIHVAPCLLDRYPSAADSIARKQNHSSGKDHAVSIGKGSSTSNDENNKNIKEHDSDEFPHQMATFCFPDGGCRIIQRRQRRQRPEQSNTNQNSRRSLSISNSRTYDSTGRTFTPSSTVHNIPDPTICTTVLTSGTGRRLYMSTLTVYEQLLGTNINHLVGDETKNDNDDNDLRRKKSCKDSTSRQEREWWLEHPESETHVSNEQQRQSKRFKGTTGNTTIPVLDDDDDNETHSVVVFVPKCLALISSHPYYHAQVTILKELYYTISSGHSPIPFERYVANIVDATPMPLICRHEHNRETQQESTASEDIATTTITTSVGVVEWKSWIGGNKSVKFQLLPPWQWLDVSTGSIDGKNRNLLSGSSVLSQTMSIHKPFNVSLEALFRTISLSNVLVLWATLLQEGKVVLSCHPNNTALLTPIAEALLGLLHPLEWQGIYIPLLPTPATVTTDTNDHSSSQNNGINSTDDKCKGSNDASGENGIMELLEAPVPFLIGMTTTKLSSLSHPHGVVWCDLDNDIVHLGYNEDGSFIESIPCLPEKAVMRLKVELEEVADPLYLPTLEGIKGQMTTGDRTILFENALREPYALRTKLFDERRPPTQAFSRSYILSQSSKIGRRKIPLDKDNFILQYDAEEVTTSSPFCCFGSTKVPATDTENSVSTQLLPETMNTSASSLNSESVMNNPLNDVTNANKNENQFIQSLTRSSRQMQAHADRFLAVFGQKDFATPSLYASRASSDKQFAQDALQRQDEVASELFEVNNNEKRLVQRIRSSFESFFATLLAEYDFQHVQSDRQDVRRFVRTLGLPREQEQFMKAMMTTQMFNVLVHNDDQRRWLESSTKRNKLTGEKLKATAGHGGSSNVYTIAAPSPYAGGIPEGESFNQDRRFPDMLRPQELIIEKVQNETPKSFWSSLLDGSIDHALFCCGGHNVST